jgi:hypothetical protein
MKTALILAAILAATPAMACTDWRAIAAFDAVIVANDQKVMDLVCAGGKLADATSCGNAAASSNPHMLDTINDRIHALADKCQENAR